MRIAVINETSACDKNPDIMAALDGRGHELINAGMREKGSEPELTYIHTGFLSALLLNSGAVDFVVGGCGTGQGYLNSAMQYPGVFCGLIGGPLDAWLFTQINGGNAISLPLNQGYGWAADVNLQFLFDRIFSVERGCGYPEHRQVSQKESRDILSAVSDSVHYPFRDVVRLIPEAVFGPAVAYPGVMDLLDEEWRGIIEARRTGAAL